MSRRRGLGDCWSGTEPVSSPHAGCLYCCVRVCLPACVCWKWREHVCVRRCLLPRRAAQTTVQSAVRGEDGWPSQDIWRRLILTSTRRLGFRVRWLCVNAKATAWAPHPWRSQDIWMKKQRLVCRKNLTPLYFNKKMIEKEATLTSFKYNDADGNSFNDNTSLFKLLKARHVTFTGVKSSTHCMLQLYCLN